MNNSHYPNKDIYNRYLLLNPVSIMQSYLANRNIQSYLSKILPKAQKDGSKPEKQQINKKPSIF